MIKERPFPVTLVCLFLLAWNSYQLINSFANLKKEATIALMALIKVPYELQVAMLYLDWAVLIVSAMFMMQEKNWARWLFLGWGFAYIDYSLYIQPVWQDNLIMIGVYLVCAFILLMPSANEFFQEEKWV